MVQTQMPVLLTVIESANDPRVPAAKRMMKHKNAKAPVEIEKQLKAENPGLDEGQLRRRLDQEVRSLEQRGSLIEQWDLAAIGADLAWCGRTGSPTKVYRIQSVVLAAKESKEIEPTEEGIARMVGELIEDKIIA